MKLIAVISYLLCFHQSNAYFFPICSSENDESCVNYFSLPSFNFPLSFTSHEEGLFGDAEDPTKPATNMIFQVIGLVFNPLGPLTTFYKDKINPFVAQTYRSAIDNAPFVKYAYSRVAPYIPLLKYEEKVKADSKLYILFIGTSIAVYLALYIYFTKKLYYYYQASLREQYLNNVKKIFKGKD